MNFTDGIFKGHTGTIFNNWSKTNGEGGEEVLERWIYILKERSLEINSYRSFSKSKHRSDKTG